MKIRKILCTLCGCLLAASLTPTAQAAGMTAAVTTEPVTLNGRQIDNSTAEYPLLVYRDITYFPMTYDLCRFLGVSTQWKQSSSTLYIDKSGENGAYIADSGSIRRRGNVSVTRVGYPVVVNGTEVHNESARWPLINYNNVTYFPLTWSFAVDEFGWDYHWDADSGLWINSTGTASDVSVPAISAEDPSDGISGSDASALDSYSDGEAINAANRGFAGAAWGGVPESLTVELNSNWTLQGIKDAIRKGLEDFARGGPLEGQLAEVQISYSASFPAEMQSGMTLEVPYTAVYNGKPITLPSGKSYTPSAVSEEVTALVRLTGQGAGGTADSAFQAGQEMYQRLAECAKTKEIVFETGKQMNAIEALMSAISARLNAEGLESQYTVQSITFGPHTDPNYLTSGASTVIDFTVIFSPLQNAAIQQNFTVISQVTFRAA